MQLLRDMGLDKEADTAVRRLSGGMKRRVAIVRALAFGGEALLLDEPFNGLDAENRRTAAVLILKTAAENRMPVLISSHIDEDAALLKARVFKVLKKPLDKSEQWLYHVLKGKATRKDTPCLKLPVKENGHRLKAVLARLIKDTAFRAQSGKKD